MSYSPVPSMDGLRIRVSRLLRGEARADDLPRLFLFARDRCDGRESVQEIGDFVAHHEERTKGIVTRGARDFFTMATFVTKYHGQPLELSRLPPEFPDYLAANSRTVDALTLRSQVKLQKHTAAKLVSNIKKRLVARADGTYSLERAELSPTELRLTRFLINNWTVRNIFSDDRLFDDFSATLRSQGLISNQESRQLYSAKARISLFAMTVMLRAVIRLGADIEATLNVDIDGGKLFINAKVPSHLPQVLFAFGAFRTSLHADEHCEANLLSSKPSEWSWDIELSDSGRLKRKNAVVLRRALPKTVLVATRTMKSHQ